METIENIHDYQNYWERKMFWNEELMNCWANDNVITSFELYDSSSPDGAGSSSAAKNIVSERNRRKKPTDSWANDDVITSFGLYDSSLADGAGSSLADKNIVSERNTRKKLTASWANDDVITSFGLYDSSSPDRAGSSSAAKNIASERNRRKKLTDKLLALREAVPKITKLDKASIIKDAIVYIQDLQEEERRLEAEIKELKNARGRKNPGYDHFEQELPVLLISKKMRINPSYDHVGITRSPIQVLDLRVSSVGVKARLVNLTCSKRMDTLVLICEVFDYLKLKIITANVSIVSGMVKKMVLVETDEEERDLKIKIEKAIEALTESPLASI